MELVAELNQMIDAFDEVAFQRYKGVEGWVDLNESQSFGWHKLERGWRLVYENRETKKIEPLRRAPVSVRVEAGIKLPELIKVLDANLALNNQRTHLAVENLREAVYALRVK